MSSSPSSSNLPTSRPDSSEVDYSPDESSDLTTSDSEIDLKTRKVNRLMTGLAISQPKKPVEPPKPPKFPQLENEISQHLKFVSLDSTNQADRQSALLEELRTTPLFSSSVRHLTIAQPPPDGSKILPQYGLLGLRVAQYSNGQQRQTPLPPRDNLIYTNMNAPWSAFICGSQGAGKSHTLSCLLENALLKTSQIGTLPKPLAGIVFHYDKHAAHSASQICEAAYLCSKGIPVRVYVSPTNFWTMEKLYTNLPGLPKNSPKPIVLPLRLHEDQLTVTNIKTLMAVDNDSTHPPLYLAVLNKVLKQIAIENQGKKGINYNLFKKRLEDQTFTRDQRGPLELRLDLLESFLQIKGAPNQPANSKKTKSSPPSSLSFEPGALTIVDMSCPFVDEKDACALFSICLSLFLERRSEAGVVIALDEAHKFLTESGEAARFTDDLIGIICQQRHLGSRVLIATQEPTLSTRLLDLCNVTLVHRFLSPAWYATLKGHLAGLVHRQSSLRVATSTIDHDSDGEEMVEDIFKTIVKLRTGEALLFSPTACLDVETYKKSGQKYLVCLQERYVKIQIRNRVTADGGRSILALK